MSLRFVCVVLLLASATVPIGVSAQRLPAFLQVRASDVVTEPAAHSRDDRWSHQQNQAAQLMAWGAGIGASLLPYAGVAYAMKGSCYDRRRSEPFATELAMYGILGGTAIVLAATGIARLRRLPEGYRAAHPLSHEQRVRAGNVGGLAMLTSLAFASLMTLPDRGICGSS